MLEERGIAVTRIEKAFKTAFIKDVQLVEKYQFPRLRKTSLIPGKIIPFNFLIGYKKRKNECNYFQKGGQYKGGYSSESNAIHLFAAADQFTIMLCVYPLSYSSAASSGDGYTIQPAEQKRTITMPLSQWNELKQELIEQENDLTQLRQKLKMLRSTSSEQIQLLENLQSELNATRQSLMNANVSLTECRNELEKSKASLETLKQEIKQMEHKQVVLIVSYFHFGTN